MNLLILNCRSYSLTFHLFNITGEKLLAHGGVERIIVGGSFLTLQTAAGESLSRRADCPDHRAALALVIDACAEAAIDLSLVAAVGHRVAHGGEHFTASVVIDDQVLAAVKGVEPLAPLHNGPNIAGIEAALLLLPALPQVAVFDTAFHQTLPPHAYLYPLPYDWYENYGIRRYGFHGASHADALRRGARLLGKKPADCSMVTVHVGSGVSLCAIRGGVSIDTSMGLTPLEGVIMDTRCGDIDPGIPPFMMAEQNLTARDMDGVLNLKSGLLGITGRFTDRREISAAAAAGDRRCQLAQEMEAYRLRKYIGGYAAIAGPLDAVVFATSIEGAEWPVRELALAGMDALGIRLDPERNRQAAHGEGAIVSTDDSPVKVCVIPTHEERIIAREVAEVIGNYRQL